MELTVLAAAVATSMAVHRVMEPSHVLSKLARLDKAIKTGKIDEVKPKGIDTRAKAYSIGLLFMAVFTALAYPLFVFIDLDTDATLWYIISITIIGEVILMMRVDAYHVAIEKMTKTHAKQAKK